jgi:hypothetical protein
MPQRKPETPILGIRETDSSRFSQLSSNSSLTATILPNKKNAPTDYGMRPMRITARPFHTREHPNTAHMRMTKPIWLALPILVLTLVFVTSGSAQPHSTGKQGCVNQGTDTRVGGSVVCWAQRHLSWKSQHKPHFLLIGKQSHTSLGLAWPPYIVYNSPSSDGGWRMFRIGFRYDRMWHGYIFPTAAWKVVAEPLQY